MHWGRMACRFTIILLPTMVRIISNIRLIACARKGMAVYAVTEDGQHLVLVRQYRYPMDDYLYELPAGLIEPGGTASEAACGEMIEETGWKLEGL